MIGAGAPRERLAAVASALESRIGDLLVAFIRRIAAGSPATRLCVGGSVFYHSDFNSRVKLSGAFDDVFVPINPGDAGLALGTAMHASPTSAAPSGRSSARRTRRRRSSQRSTTAS